MVDKITLIWDFVCQMYASSQNTKLEAVLLKMFEIWEPIVSRGWEAKYHFGSVWLTKKKSLFLHSLLSILFLQEQGTCPGMCSVYSISSILHLKHIWPTFSCRQFCSRHCHCATKTIIKFPSLQYKQSMLLAQCLCPLLEIITKNVAQLLSL